MQRCRLAPSTLTCRLNISTLETVLKLFSDVAERSTSPVTLSCLLSLSQKNASSHVCPRSDDPTVSSHSCWPAEVETPKAQMWLLVSSDHVSHEAMQWAHWLHRLWVERLRSLLLVTLSREGMSCIRRTWMSMDTSCNP